MTRGYWNVPSPFQLCYHLIYIAWPFLLGWWRHKWTAPKANCKDLYDQSARAYSSEHPTVDIHLMEYAVSWHGSHRKYAVQCFFCWSMEFCENIWTNFHLWGPRSYSSIQDNTTASSYCFQCKESLRKEVLTAQNTSPMQCKDNLNAIEVWESK